MNKLKVVKFLAEMVIPVGVGAIVGSAVKLTVTPETKILKKIAIGIGGTVLTAMISDAASKYVTDRIDTTANVAEAIKLGIDKRIAEKEGKDYVIPEPTFTPLQAAFVEQEIDRIVKEFREVYEAEVASAAIPDMAEPSSDVYPYQDYVREARERNEDPLSYSDFVKQRMEARRKNQAAGLQNYNKKAE